MLMIKSVEPVYKELEGLFMKKLPEYIAKNNKEYNDGIILKTFENHLLEEYGVKRPYFKFGIEEAEYSEKDRIIENTIVKINLELMLPQEIKKKTIFFWRYAKAIQRMLEETESNYIYKITKIIESKIIIEITLCR